MELTLDQALQKGVEAHKAGQVQEADRYYTAILKAQPNHPDANHNMGVLAVGVGKVEQSLRFFKTALEANPKIAQFWLSYIDALIKLDRIEDAKSIFDQAKSNGAQGDGFDKLEQRIGTLSKKERSQDPPKEQLQPLVDLYSQGQYQETLDLASQLLNKFPNSVKLYNIFGASNQSLGKLDKAIKNFKTALLFKPDYAETHNNMGVIFKEQGKLEEAIEAYTKALFIKPDFAESHYNLGVIFQEQGKLNEAIEAYTKALSIKSDYVQAYNNMGVAFRDQYRLEEAIEAYTTALTIKPKHVEAHNNLGNALKDLGRLEEAIEAYNKALLLEPDNAEVYNNKGVLLRDKNQQEEAISAFKKALKIMPDYFEAHHNLSRAQKYTSKNSHFNQVEKLYKASNLSDDAKCHLSFALAKMYEDIGDLDKSFAFSAEGNSLRKKLLKYSIDEDKSLFAILKRSQPHLLKSSLEIKDCSTELKPIFILGMPRSGTTLVEQIISSHSDVTGAGELNHVVQFGRYLALDSAVTNTETISKFRHKYLSEVLKQSNGKQFITDKMPQNFRFIPLICAAFPEAKIIHVQRNAIATCWSNFKQYFAEKGLGYSYDLNDVVEYYELYRDLMEFWQSEYGDRIYNLNYERLTTDQENQTRKLINYLDLTWEESCLSPHKNKRSVRTASQQQVRKKIYKGSSEAWRKYEPYLNGVFDSLTSI